MIRYNQDADELIIVAHQGPPESTIVIPNASVHLAGIGFTRGRTCRDCGAIVGKRHDVVPVVICNDCVLAGVAW